MPGRRDLLLGAMTLATAGTAYAAMPRKKIMTIGKGQLDKVVPLKVGPWEYETASGLVLPPPDQLEQLLYDQQVTRAYSAQNQLPVMLLMAYGSSQSGMLQIHRPEICYPSSGFRLSDTRIMPMETQDGHDFPVRTFTARGDTRTEQVLYWTRIGNLVPASWAAQRLAVMRQNIEGYIPDGLLVRLSTVSEDEGQAQATLRTFVRTMLAEIGPQRREMLIGPAGA